MAMRQAALYMLRHPYKYFKCVEQELLRSGESYESYCYNIFNKNVWGDDFIAAVFGDMWNVAISIIMPISRKPMALFHNKDNPDVVNWCQRRLLHNAKRMYPFHSDSQYRSEVQTTRKRIHEPYHITRYNGKIGACCFG